MSKHMNLRPITMTRSPILLAFFVIFFSLSACNSSQNGDNVVVLSEKGTLVWGYPPAVDGTGMTFRRTDSSVYALSGSRADYAEYFSTPDTNRALIEIDYVITDEEEIRGWGARFRLIEALDIRIP